jgi:hypothetical protein
MPYYRKRWNLRQADSYQLKGRLIFQLLRLERSFASGDFDEYQ